MAGILFPVKPLFAQNKEKSVKPSSLPSTPPALPQKKMSKANLAMSYYYGGDYKKAAVLFKELYKKSNSYNYYRLYYNSLIKINDLKEAEKICKRQIRQSPGNYRFKIDLAYVYSRQGEEKKARKILNRIVTDLPDNRNVIVNIAANLQARGFYEKAIDVYHLAEEKNLGNGDYNMELAMAYRYAGDYDKMFDAYLEHLARHPNNIFNIENQIQNILVMDVDDNLSRLFREKLLLKVQQDPSNAVFAELLMWYSLQIKDFNLALKQAKSIDKRFKDQELKVLEVAQVALANRAYEVTEEAARYLLKKKKNNPYFAESYELYFKAKLKLAEEKPTDLSEKDWLDLDKIGETALSELGLNGSWEIIKSLAHIKAFRLNEPQAALQLLDNGIAHAIYTKEKAELKMEKADILAYEGKFWDASLLYAQVEESMKNEPLGHEAKFRNAQVFYFKGEFQWAKTRLDVLKGATSKFIANDALELSLFIKEMLEADSTGKVLKMFASADRFAYRQQYDSALAWLNKIDQLSSLPLYKAFTLYKKAAIFDKMKKYEEADKAYARLVAYYPDHVKADNALFRQAEINRIYLKNKEKAKKLYLLLMKNYPESIYATEARKYYRQLE